MGLVSWYSLTNRKHPLASLQFFPNPNAFQLAKATAFSITVGIELRIDLFRCSSFLIIKERIAIRGPLAGQPN